MGSFNIVFYYNTPFKTETALVILEQNHEDKNLFLHKFT